MKTELRMREWLGSQCFLNGGIQSMTNMIFNHNMPGKTDRPTRRRHTVWRAIAFLLPILCVLSAWAQCPDAKMEALSFTIARPAVGYPCTNSTPPCQTWYLKSTTGIVGWSEYYVDPDSHGIYSGYDGGSITTYIPTILSSGVLDSYTVPSASYTCWVTNTIGAGSATSYVTNHFTKSTNDGSWSPYYPPEVQLSYFPPGSTTTVNPNSCQDTMTTYSFATNNVSLTNDLYLTNESRYDSADSGLEGRVDALCGAGFAAATWGQGTATASHILSSDASTATAARAKFRIRIEGTDPKKHYTITCYSNEFYMLGTSVVTNTSTQIILASGLQGQTGVWYFTPSGQEVTQPPWPPGCPLGGEHDIGFSSPSITEDPPAVAPGTGIVGQNSSPNASSSSGGCQSCGGGSATGNTLPPGYAFSMSMGAANNGGAAGSFYAMAPAPNDSLMTPASLQFSGAAQAGSGVQVFYNGGSISQVLAPQAFAVVTVNSAYSYRIDVYLTNALGTWNGTGYNVINGPTNLITTWTIANPDAAPNLSRLQVSEAPAGSSTPNVWLCSYGTATGIWTNSLPGGQLVQWMSQGYNPATQTRSEVVQWAVPGGAVTYQRVKVYTNYDWGEGLISDTIGVGADARTTTYTYYNSSDSGYAASSSQPPIQSVIQPDGGWTYYESYDSLGRPLGAVSGIDGAYSTDYSTGRLVQYDYTPIDSADDGSIRTNTARTETVTYKGTPVSVTYRIYQPGEDRLITCPVSYAGYADAGNLVTTTRYFTSGGFNGCVQSVSNADGTMTIYNYFTNSAGTMQTNITATGQPDNMGATIIAGVSNVTVLGPVGQVLSQKQVDIASGVTLANDSYTYLDNAQRSYTVTHLDLTTETVNYACCGLENTTDRDGIQTVYLYDAAKRQYGYETILGSSIITYTNLLDAAGNVLKAVRVGTNSSAITLRQAQYNTAGELVSQINALGGTNTYGRSNDGTTGGLITTTINPDGGTVTNDYCPDGSLSKVTGTAARPTRYVYGAQWDGSDNRVYVQQIKLDASYNDTSEWTTSYTDAVGRNCRTVYADRNTTPYSITYYNTLGQLTNQMDPDRDWTYYQYNAKGQQEYTINDYYQDGGLHKDGMNRVTQVVSDATNDASLGVNVRRTRTFVWSTTGLDASNLVSMTETSADGLRSWNTLWNAGKGLTNFSQMVYAGGGYRYLTNKAADGSYSIRTYLYGRLLSTLLRDANNIQVSLTTNGYDAHGRVNAVWDARTGTTSYAFNNADQVSSVTTPSPTEVTTYYFDYQGRGWKTTLPDNTSTTNWFYPTGDLEQTAGSRTYPVFYTYDAQGRMNTMTTWTNFAANAGAAVTTWNYDGYHGFLANKTYNNGVTAGPAYTYTPTGRLLTRAWARGITTTYGYDNAGALTSVAYSDGSTPGIAYVNDRRGRSIQITVGSSFNTYLTYNDQNQVLTESNSNPGGALDGLSVTNGYDSLLRRTNLVALDPAVLATALYGYDAASRLSTVSDGTNSATYSYLANSPLVGNIVFQQSTTTRMTTTRNYDNLNRLTSVSNINASVVLDSHGYSYNSANQRTSVANADGTYWAYQYDALGQVTSGIKHWSDGSVVAGQQFGYGFDNIGNRQTTTSGGDQWGGNLRNASYHANSLNEYTNMTVPGAVDVMGSATNTATVTVNDQATYRKGNYFRSQLALTNSTGALWQAATNLAVLNVGTNYILETNITGNVFLPQTPESFTYDADGNLTQDGRWTYTWDGENRLVQMTVNTNVGPQYQINFAYDAKGRRIQKLVANNSGPLYTNNFLYDGWNLIAEVGPGNALIRSYIWGSDLSGSMQGAGGVGGLLEVTYCGSSATNCFIAFDGNGDVSALVNAANSTILSQYEYGPFGEVIRATGPMAKLNPFRFSTKYQDDESDLLYYGFRYYTASEGRWVSRDPVQEMGGINLYVLVDNSPQNLTDFLGLEGTNDPKKPVVCPACKCKSLKKPTDKQTLVMGLYTPDGIGFGGPQSQRYGAAISWEWEVVGDGSKCNYALKEAKGLVTGTTPPNTPYSSDGTSDYDKKANGFAPVGQTGSDPMGIIVDKPGQYSIDASKLVQTFRCIDSDDDWKNPAHPMDVTINYTATASKINYPPTK